MVARAQNSLARLVRPKVSVFERQQLGETGARTIDATLDRADRALTDRGRFLIGKARRAHEQQRLALIVRQLGKRRPEFAEIDTAELLRLQVRRIRIAVVGL